MTLEYICFNNDITDLGQTYSLEFSLRRQVLRMKGKINDYNSELPSLITSLC